jgi:hypothetical protein
MFSTYFSKGWKSGAVGVPPPTKRVCGTKSAGRLLCSFSNGWKNPSTFFQGLEN